MSARQKTQVVRDLEAKVYDLRAYQEAFFCLRKGMAPVALSSGEGEQLRSIELLGAARASGGVVLTGAQVLWANDWLATVQGHGDPYLNDLAHKVIRETDRAVAATPNQLSIPTGGAL